MELIRGLEDWSKSWVEYMEHQETPKLFNHWTSLFMIASAVERKVFLKWEKDVFCNLFLAFVALPGGRKGTAMGPAEPILRDLGLHIAANKTTQEALIRALKKAGENFTVSDGRIQANASLTIFSKELTVFLGYKNLDFMSNLADWYDCDQFWEYDTKTQGKDTIKKLWVNLLGATTPDLLQEALPTLSFGSGLNSRFIYVFAEKGDRKIVVFPFSNTKNEELKEKLIKDLSMIHVLSGEFRKDQSYLNRWGAWYPSWAEYGVDVGCERSPVAKSEKMTGYMERRPTHLHKVAMLYSLSRSNELVLRDIDFDRAIRLLQITEIKMAKTFEGIGQSSFASLTAKILNYIRSHQEVVYSDLSAQFSYDVMPRDLSAIISSLEYSKYVQTYRIEREGKPYFYIKYTGKE
jgi:hypothetical protein